MKKLLLILIIITLITNIIVVEAIAHNWTSVLGWLVAGLWILYSHQDKK